MHFFLIPGTTLIKHAEVADANVSRPTAADGLLYHRLTRFAHFAQGCIAGKNNALIFRQWLAPGRAAHDRAHPSPQATIIQRLTVWIEPRELMKLHRGTRHDEAAPRVTVGWIFFLRRRAQKRDALVVFEHRRVREREGVAIEIKIGTL